MALAIHIVARARDGEFPLRDQTLGAALWGGLRRTFPHALACVLMPNHVHLLLPQARVGYAVWSLGIVLRSFTRRYFLGQPLWEPIPGPKYVENRKALLREIRYIHLNPCREGLAPDPLAWRWSTHRDVMGCAWPAWVSASRIAEAASWRRGDFANWLHHYISSDPSASVTGTLPPIREVRNSVTPSELWTAAEEVLRVNPLCKAEARRCTEIVLALAPEYGIEPAQITPLFELSRTAAWEARLRGNRLLDAPIRIAVQFALADARLRTFDGAKHRKGGLSAQKPNIFSGKSPLPRKAEAQIFSMRAEE